MIETSLISAKIQARSSGNNLGKLIQLKRVVLFTNLLETFCSETGWRENGRRVEKMCAIIGTNSFVFDPIAVRDRTFLRMQDFDFCPNLISFTKVYPIYPDLPKFYQNLPKLA